MSRKIQNRNLFVRKKPQFSRILSVLLGLIALLCLMYGSIFLLPIVPNKANITEAPAYKVKIKPQSSLASIADQAKEQGLRSSTLFFQLGARAIFVGSKLKPGTYLLQPGASLGKVLLQIARGDRVRESIAIIPGMTIWQLRNLVDAHPALTHQTKGMNSKELLQALNLSYPGLEGLFLPDTYIFDPEDSDINIYHRAALALQKTLNQEWGLKDSQFPLQSPYDLLILASIIEKETGRAGERGKIAAVFLNRIKKGMPLQTDPTVIYGIGPRFDGNLRKADLRQDNPYNTYMHKGLPPTPIAMPSRESINAAAHPEQTNSLYFVAKGDASSHFSITLDEHEKAVDRYQRKASSKPSNLK